MPRYLIEGCNFILSVEWFRNSSSDGRHPTTSSHPLRVPVLISRADIESVYYVAGDRSGDRSLGKVAGYFCSRWTWEWFWDESSERERGGRRWKKRRTGHLDVSPRASLLDARACGRADHTYTRAELSLSFSLLWVPTRRSRCNTRVVPCMHVHAVCNARNRYFPIEIR